MISVERTADAAQIGRIITHPKIYRHMCDDGAPSADGFDAAHWISGPANVALLAIGDDGAAMSAFMASRVNDVTSEIYICILPEYWDLSDQIMGLSIEWVFANTETRKLVFNVHEHNMFSFKLARRAGFSLEGVNRKSVMRKGKLVDLLVFGLCESDM